MCTTKQALKLTMDYVHEVSKEMDCEQYIAYLEELFFELDEERRKLEWREEPEEYRNEL